MLDPSSGEVYHYDIASFKAPDTDQNMFILGTESTQTWRAYINVCGNAQVVGCADPTPVCQDDGAGAYISMGAPSTWTFSPYFNISQGPSAPICDGGVVATMSHGQVCESTQTARSTTIFLKCDPSVSVRPTTAVVSEVNPYTGETTPCKYWVGPIAHRDFCPVKAVTIPDNAPVYFLYATLFPNVTVTFEAITTDASLLQEAGFQCAPINASCSNAFHCKGTASESGDSKVPLMDLKFTYGESIFSWSSTNGGSAKCPDDVGGYFKANGPDAAWVVGSSGITAAVGPKSILSLSSVYSQSCFECKSNR